MWGTIRTTDPDNKTGAFIRQRMTEISEGVAKAFRCTAEVEFSDYCPCMMVDKALAQDAMTYMTDLLGKGAWIWPRSRVENLAAAVRTLHS